MTLPAERIKLTTCFVAAITPYVKDPSTIARRLERGCYNATVVQCIEDSIPRQWGHAAFTQRYSAECYRVLSALGSNADGSLIKGLVDGSIDPTLVAEMSNFQLSPNSTLTERDAHAKRLAARVDKKYSDDTCRKCNAKQVHRVQVQTRAADEMASFHFMCDGCGNTWGS